MPNGQDAIWNLRNVHLFKGLAMRELRELAPLLQTHDYHQGQFIFHMGEKADRLFFLDRGTVKITRISPEGEERILDIFNRGDIFGELFFGKDKRRVATAQAITSVTARTMTEEAFRGLMRTRPDLCLNFVRHLVDHERRTLARMEALLHVASGPRVLAMLLDLGERSAQLSDDRYTLLGNLTQENLARMAGLNRSTVSTVINEYRQKGILGGQRGMLVIYRSRARAALKEAGLTLG